VRLADAAELKDLSLPARALALAWGLSFSFIISFHIISFIHFFYLFLRASADQRERPEGRQMRTLAG
jgi:hypothetical protein